MPEITKSHALDIARAAIRREAHAIQKLESELGEPFWQCARMLIDCPGLVWVTAVGTSAAVGMRFAHILTCSGARAMFLSPSDGLHGHTNVMQPGEVLVASVQRALPARKAQRVTRGPQGLPARPVRRGRSARRARKGRRVRPGPPG